MVNVLAKHIARLFKTPIDAHNQRLFQLSSWTEEKMNFGSPYPTKNKWDTANKDHHPPAHSIAGMAIHNGTPVNKAIMAKTSRYSDTATGTFLFFSILPPFCRLQTHLASQAAGAQEGLSVFRGKKALKQRTFLCKDNYNYYNPS